MPSDDPVSLDMGSEEPIEEFEVPSLLVVAFSMHILQLTGQKCDNFTPFSSVLHIVTFSPLPNAAAS